MSPAFAYDVEFRRLKLRRGRRVAGGPRPERHLCLGCHEHPARFRYRGEVRADRDHNLCFRCYRAEVNRQRARAMVAA